MMKKCPVTGMCCCCPMGKAGSLLRMALAVLLLFMGVSKFIMGLTVFVDTMSQPFSELWFPASIARGFLYLVPFIEVALGILLIVGHKMKHVFLTAAGIFFLILLFGTTIMGELAGVQMNLIIILVVAGAIACMCDCWGDMCGGCCEGEKGKSNHDHGACCDGKGENHNGKEGCCGGKGECCTGKHEHKGEKKHM